MGAVFVVFARAPQTGRVKTRLAATLGDAEALAIYRRLGAHTLEVVREAAARQTDARVVVYHVPPEETRAMASWLGRDLEYRPQCDGDLGARMSTAIGAEIARGATAVVIVGTDCPDLDADVLARANAMLDSADVVLGPATDGGYYLVATRGPHAVLFERIPWSSADTLRHTLAAAERGGLTVRLLDELTDIDTAEDWRAWSAREPHHPMLAPESGR